MAAKGSAESVVTMLKPAFSKMSKEAKKAFVEEQVTLSKEGGGCIVFSKTY